MTVSSFELRKSITRPTHTQDYLARQNLARLKSAYKVALSRNRNGGFQDATKVMLSSRRGLGFTPKVIFQVPRQNMRFEVSCFGEIDHEAHTHANLAGWWGWWGLLEGANKVTVSRSENGGFKTKVAVSKKENDDRTNPTISRWS